MFGKKWHIAVMTNTSLSLVGNGYINHIKAEVFRRILQPIYIRLTPAQQYLLLMRIDRMEPTNQRMRRPRTDFNKDQNPGILANNI